MKTYADLCLERALKATEGPWKTYKCSYSNGEACGIDPLGGFDYSMDECHHPLSTENADFMSNARTDVPELARRLKIACEELKFVHLYYAHIYDANPIKLDMMKKYQTKHQRLAKALETLPEEK